MELGHPETGISLQLGALCEFVNFVRIYQCKTADLGFINDKEGNHQVVQIYLKKNKLWVYY